MKNLRTTFEEIIIKAIASDSCRVLTTMEPYISQLLDAVAEEMEKVIGEDENPKGSWIDIQSRNKFRSEIRTRLKEVTQ